MQFVIDFNSVMVEAETWDDACEQGRKMIGNKEVKIDKVMKWED